MIETPYNTRQWRSLPRNGNCAIGERFFEKIEETEDGCWRWLEGLTGEGYGQFWADGQNRLAHRWAYEYFIGSIPDGLTLDHLCRNRECVNPEHLEPVTRAENVARGNGISALNARKTHCVHGHPLDEENTYYDGNGHRSCRECRREVHRQRRAEGKSTRPPRWYSTRERILERDGRSCQVRALLGNPCSGVLGVHHIIPRQHGGEEEDDNLITVCAKHHPSLEALARRVWNEPEWKRCPHPHRTREAREACERRLNAREGSEPLGAERGRLMESEVA